MNLSKIKELVVNFKSKDFGTSLYLNIDGKERRRSQIKTTLNHLIDEELKNPNLNKEQLKNIRTDIGKIRAFAEYDLVQKENKGLVVFAKSKLKIFETIYIPQPVEDRLFISKNLLIRPLVGLFDSYSDYLTVLIDQNRGMFFELEHGQTTDFYYFREEVPNKVKEGGIGGYDERRIEKHIDEHLLRHYQNVAEKTLKMIMIHPNAKLILVGKAETLSVFKKTLHPYVKERLAADVKINLGKFPSDVIMSRVYKTIEEIRNENHQNLTTELNNKYPYQAVIGLDNVNLELNKKNVHKLLLSESFNRVYPVCNNCNYLVHNQLICSKCGADISLVDYEINEATIKALKQNSEIHFIKGHPFEKHGGIGAILK